MRQSYFLSGLILFTLSLLWFFPVSCANSPTTIIQPPVTIYKLVTATDTPTGSPTSTFTLTTSPTSTYTPVTILSTSTFTPTGSPTPSFTFTLSPTITPTPTSTDTPVTILTTATFTQTFTPTNSPTVTITRTPTNSPTKTPTATITNTFTPTTCATAGPSMTPVFSMGMGPGDTIYQQVSVPRSGYVSSLTFNANLIQAGPANVNVALYSDNSGIPGGRLALSTARNLNVAASGLDATFAITPTFVSAGFCWVAICYNAGIIFDPGYDTIPGNAYYSVGNFLPSSFPIGIPYSADTFEARINYCFYP